MTRFIRTSLTILYKLKKNIFSYLLNIKIQIKAKKKSINPLQKIAKTLSTIINNSSKNNNIVLKHKIHESHNKTLEKKLTIIIIDILVIVFIYEDTFRR